MEKPEPGGEIWIRRYDGFLECDVIVTVRGRQMILPLPNYGHAVKWAEMEAKAHRMAIDFSKEQPIAFS
jgi:hypothetical protein